MRASSVPTDTERVVVFLREHPGSSVMEVRMGLWISNVTARMSDAREAGVAFTKYRVVDPEPVQIAAFFAETA